MARCAVPDYKLLARVVKCQTETQDKGRTGDITRDPIMRPLVAARPANITTDRLTAWSALKRLDVRELQLREI